MAHGSLAFFLFSFIKVTKVFKSVFLSETERDFCFPIGRRVWMCCPIGRTVLLCCPIGIQVKVKKVK